MSKQVTVQIIITDHAFIRTKERLGLDKKATERHAMKAYVAGLQHKNCKLPLKKHVDELYLRYKTCDNIRIYGEVVFLFSRNKLITVYQLPNELKRLANK